MLPVAGVQDVTPVKAHAMCKAITVEDSFKSCTSLGAARNVLTVLAPDLVHRLHEELQVNMYPAVSVWDANICLFHALSLALLMVCMRSCS